MDLPTLRDEYRTTEPGATLRILYEQDTCRTRIYEIPARGQGDFAVLEGVGEHHPGYSYRTFYRDHSSRIAYELKVSPERCSIIDTRNRQSYNFLRASSEWLLSNTRLVVGAKLHVGTLRRSITIDYAGRRLHSTQAHICFRFGPGMQDETVIYTFRDLPQGIDCALIGMVTVAAEQQRYLRRLHAHEQSATGLVSRLMRPCFNGQSPPTIRGTSHPELPATLHEMEGTQFERRTPEVLQGPDTTQQKSLETQRRPSQLDLGMIGTEREDPRRRRQLPRTFLPGPRSPKQR